eukprot:5995184-Pleurochrysis_carterae.AAC.2
MDSACSEKAKAHSTRPHRKRGKYRQTQHMFRQKLAKNIGCLVTSVTSSGLTFVKAFCVRSRLDDALHPPDAARLVAHTERRTVHLTRPPGWRGR